VRRLVEMHGGSVEAFSEGAGKGSEFVVRLPVAHPPTGGVAGKSSEDRVTARPSKRRVLIVDDNKDSAVSLSMILKILGHVTRTAHDGIQAVRTAETFRPEVVLLDIGLPKLNGYEACRKIREQPWAREAVLIALTGWGQEEDKERSREAGFDFHLVKPVDPAALEKLLSGLLVAPS
jgi:CheY-like chemotaxis protein